MIFAVHEAEAGEPVSAQKAVGIFSVTGLAQALKIDLPDGTYTDAITGKMVDVFEKTVACDGEPVILLL